MCTEDDALVRLTATEEHYLRTALALLVDQKGDALCELSALDPASPGRGLAIEAINEQIDNIRNLIVRLRDAIAVFVVPDPED